MAGKYAALIVLSAMLSITPAMASKLNGRVSSDGGRSAAYYSAIKKQQMKAGGLRVRRPGRS